MPPTALNSGESVELLLARITAPYFDIEDFDDLPTPFRTVAMDLLSAQPVVMHSGSLADSMRATMSFPLIFPPVDVNGRLLVDGGTMNNVPADIVKSMGADRVVAVNVGDLSDRESVNVTMFGVAGETIDAMMRASTRRALDSADVLVNVPLEMYGSLDWRRAADLIGEGYRAAEAMRDQLLPFAVGEAEFDSWRRARQARRRTELPAAAFIQLDGFSASDARRLDALLARHAGLPLNVEAVERDLAVVAGLDRYQTVTWRLTQDATRGIGLRVLGRVKPYAPPFMMLGVNLENTTSTDFRITATARYLAFDVVGSGSELRIDGTVGSEPGVAVELYRPIRSTPLFIAPYAGVGKQTFNFIEGDAVIARYGQTIQRIGVNGGVNIGAQSDVRLGVYVGRRSASIEVGNPGFPELRGKETGAELTWRLDTQDSQVVPTRGVLSQVRLSHVFNGPDIVVGDQTFPYNATLTQLTGTANEFWSFGRRNRMFVYGGLGTSFDSTPLSPDQFTLGAPFRIGAYDFGELKGAHYYIATGGYLRRIGRLPDFVGGPVFAGGWLENGDAFDEWRDVRWRTNGGRRARDGHHCRTRRARRVVGLRRTLADVPRGRADVPVRGRPAKSPARPRCRHHERAEWRRRNQRPPVREELRMARRQRGTLLSRPSRERPDVRGRDGTASRLLGPFDCHVGPDVLHRQSVSPTGRDTSSPADCVKERCRGPVNSARIDFNVKWEELHRESLLRELQNRIRDVRQGPDGLLYVLTAEDDGALIKIEPVPAAVQQTAR